MGTSLMDLEENVVWKLQEENVCLPVFTTIHCRLNSDKVKERRVRRFGPVKVDGKIIRKQQYYLIQNEPKTEYAEIPKQ